MRHGVPAPSRMVSLREFDDTQSQIADLRVALQTIVATVRADEADRALDDLTGRIAGVIADRLVPLAIQTFDLPPPVALGKIITATILRMDVREFRNGYELRASAPVPGQHTQHDRQLAFATVAAFSKTRFLESITLTNRDSDSIFVQTTSA